MHRRLKRAIGALAAALALHAQAAPATTALQVSDTLPAGHFMVEHGLRFWMAEVKRLTRSTVSIERVAPAQPGNATATLPRTARGKADIGFLVPSYVPDQLPLMTVSELAGLSTSSCHGTVAFMQLARPGAVLARNELAPAGLVLLFGAMLEPHHVYTREPVTSLAALNGLRIRTAGMAQGALLKTFGALPVPMPAQKTMAALKAGSVDGALLPAASVLAYDLAPVLRNGTQGPGFGAAMAAYVMDKSRFDAMPADVRDAMLSAGLNASRNVCEFLDANAGANVSKVQAQGVTHHTLNKADGERLREAGREVQQAWAADMDRRGKPGSEVLKAYMDALR